MGLIFFVFLGIAEIARISELLFIIKLSCSKPFHNTSNYVSTANIEEVMKFYNQGDKTLETDFSIDVIVTLEVRFLKISFCILAGFNCAKFH